MGTVENLKPSSRPKQSWPHIALLLLVLLVGFSLRAYCLFVEKGFWFDDIYAASFANLSLWGTVTAALRFDVHPPLYYLQVNLWSRIVGHSDQALQLNSVLWNCGALIAVYVGSLRKFGVATAIAAVGMAAVMGSDMFFSSDLRMYSMVSCLCLCAWIEAGDIAERSRLRDYWLLILLLIAIGTSHSAGVVPVSAVLLYCAPDFRAADWRTKFKTWLKACTIVGITLLPWIVLGLFRHAAKLSTADFPTVSHTIGGWPLGYNYDLPDVWREYAAVILLALLTAAYVLAPAARRTMLCFIVWPIAFVAVFSEVVRPLWYYRPFSFVCPFAAIAIGALVGRLIELSGRLNRWLPLLPAGALAATIASLGWFDYGQLQRVPPSEFVQFSRYIRDRAKIGELVYVPDYRTFWGVARYLVGPTWGDVGAVQDPIDQDHSDRWPRIYQRLGPKRLSWLDLEPRTRRVDGFRTPLFIGESPLKELESVRSFWEVEPIIKEDDFAIPDVKGCADRRIETATLAGTRVFHVICSGSSEKL
jgi:hypothetical protein